MTQEGTAWPAAAVLGRQGAALSHAECGQLQRGLFILKVRYMHAGQLRAQRDRGAVPGLGKHGSAQQREDGRQRCAETCA